MSSPLLIIFTSFETSPLELKGAVAFDEKDSFKENKGDNFCSEFLIFNKQLDPFLNEDSLTPFQLNISTKSATAFGSNHTLYFPGLSSIFGLFMSFSFLDASSNAVSNLFLSQELPGKRTFTIFSFSSIKEKSKINESFSNQ